MRFRFLALWGLLFVANSVVAQGNLPPTIVVPPASLNAYLGDAFTLAAAAEGSPPLAFQWYKNSAAISGATDTRYSVAVSTLADAGVYHLVVTNPYGAAQSLPAGVLVTKRPQTISFTPANTSAVAGSGLVLNATASSGLPIVYSLASGAASINGNLLVGTGGTVIVRASQPGNTSFDAAEPVERTFSFIAGGLSPFITSPPVDQSVTAGGTVTLQGTAIGTPAPTYQWQKDGTTLAGATHAALTLASVQLVDAGRYTLIATNPAGTSSASATLTVRAAPVITTAPVSQTVAAGDRTTFSVVATGFPAPTYQWRRNGAVMAGATGSTLTLASPTTADAGRYEVVVSNALGSVTSPAAVLTVTTRDFSGTYFGRFTGADGDFALLVRANRTAVFLAHLPAQQTGVAITSLTIDLSGNFTVGTLTLASQPDIVSRSETPATAAAPRPVTLRGSLNEATGAVSGTVAEFGLAFTGTRTPRTGLATTLAGYYQAALIGSASTRGQIIVAPDGQTLMLTANTTALDAARGVLTAGGRLTTTTSNQATLDLTFADGGVTGTARTGTSVVGTIAGAIETLAGTEHLTNLAIRTVTSPGAATLITGFVVSGTTPKQVLIRAAGPTLAQAPFNVPGVLADPTLQVFRGNVSVAQNDDWGTPAANVATITAAATRVGAFAFRAGSADAALLTTLAPGAYSVVIGGGTGTTLAEVYEVLQNNEAAGSRRLVNVSARGLVSPTAPFIAGFVIGGTGPQRVLVRGVGPSLGAPPFNVAGVLPNPQLTLFRGTSVVKTNDDWFRDPEASVIRDAAARAGAFALGAASLDAAVLLYLEPGAYTAQVSAPANANAANATGLALVEIYESTP